MRMSRLAGSVALVACAIVGIVSAVLFDGWLWANDDSCPQWEDEGPMAAPGSPYAVVMCGPLDPPLVWAVLIAAAVGVVALVLGLARWRRGGGVLAWFATAGVVLAGPGVLVGLLHVSLPEDCLTGRTEAGACGRDRELR